MDMYRFTSKSPIETTDGNYAPTGLVVEFPCYGPSDLEVEKKIKSGVRARYGIELRGNFVSCHFDWEKL